VVDESQGVRSADRRQHVPRGSAQSNNYSVLTRLTFQRTTRGSGKRRVKTVLAIPDRMPVLIHDKSGIGVGIRAGNSGARVPPPEGTAEAPLQAPSSTPVRRLPRCCRAGACHKRQAYSPLADPPCFNNEVYEVEALFFFSLYLFFRCTDAQAGVPSRSSSPGRWD